MRHFVQLALGFDPTMVLCQLAQQSQWWNQYPFRTQSAQSPHREAEDIILCAQTPETMEHDPRECVFYPAWQAFETTHEPVFALLARVRAVRLGRVLVTRLAPGAQIYPHADIGPRADGYMDHEPYWQRFHWCLDADEGSRFTAGDETVHMAPGTVWWFDGTQVHSVENRGSRDRLHLIVDCALGQRGAG